MRAPLLVISAIAALLAAPALSETPTQPTATAAPAPFDALPALDGGKVDRAALDGKVVLMVNVASRCGYTGQYAGLQSLYEKYRDAGLTIVGVPCNQFGGQEPGSAKEIARFCSMNYGVTFPMLAKQDVNGPNRSTLYDWLVSSDAGLGKDIGWNFEKFLVGRDGTVLQRFRSGTAPTDPALTGAIEAALGSS